MVTKITKRGNSLGVTITKEMQAHMNVGEGDEVFLIKTPGGYEMTARDPHFESKMENARQCMKGFRQALTELAK